MAKATMWIVARDGRGRSGNDEEVAADLVRAIAAGWCEDQRRGESDDEQAVQAFLSGVHGRQLWLGCGCNTECMPVIFIVRLANGRYGIRRSFAHGAHAEHCHFRWSEGEAGREEGAPRVRKRRDADGRLIPDFLLFHGQAQEAGRLPEERVAKRRAPAAASPLRYRLQWLCHSAGCAEIYPVKRDRIGEQLLRLREHAAHVPLVADVNLGDVLWTHQRWLVQGWCNQTAKALLRAKWPDGVPMQGYLVVLARAASGNCIETVDGTIAVRGKVEVVADGAPAIALVALRWNAVAEAFEPASACVMPRGLRTAVPLRTVVDREIAAMLQWAAQKEELRTGRAMTVRWVFESETRGSFIVDDDSATFTVLTSEEPCPDQGRGDGPMVAVHAGGEPKVQAKKVARAFFAWCGRVAR